MTEEKTVINVYNFFVIFVDMNSPVYKYRYWIFFGAFALWMTFLDTNNFIYRIRLKSDLSDLRESIKIHEEKIIELRRQKTDLFGNQRNLEKFAREKYLMKKDNEDIFVITEPETEKDN